MVSKAPRHHRRAPEHRRHGQGRRSPDPAQDPAGRRRPPAQGPQGTLRRGRKRHQASAGTVSTVNTQELELSIVPHEGTMCFPSLRHRVFRAGRKTRSSSPPATSGTSRSSAKTPASIGRNGSPGRCSDQGAASDGRHRRLADVQNLHGPALRGGLHQGHPRRGCAANPRRDSCRSTRRSACCASARVTGAGTAVLGNPSRHGRGQRWAADRLPRHRCVVFVRRRRRDPSAAIQRLDQRLSAFVKRSQAAALCCRDEASTRTRWRRRRGLSVRGTRLRRCLARLRRRRRTRTADFNQALSSRSAAKSSRNPSTRSRTIRSTASS